MPRLLRSRRVPGLLSTVLLLASSNAATTPAASGLIPRPARLDLRDGRWTLQATTRIVAAGDALAEARHLADALAPPLGRDLTVATGPARDGDVELVLTGADPELGAEGYRLDVTPVRVRIAAAGTAGLFYGGVTLRQLLPPEVFRAAAASTPPAGGWTVPGVSITDRPRFPWRGLLLDPARHFLPVASVKRFIDLMALHKFNSLQLHLTDDQGWRIEIRKYPRLTTVGSIRKESPRPGNAAEGDGTPYGPFFYTQAEIRDLVAYAAARHVTLVPEFEIPGHFRAALASYPEFSCTGGPFEVRTRWGVEPDVLCAGNDAAIAFAQDVLGEICDLFPGRFVHIGGDEAPRDRWKTCPKCQARIRAEGLKSEAQLQTWLNGRLESFLASRGRRLIGWDEILEGGLTPGAAVMSWRGMEGGLAAAQAGHDVVMSPTSHCYFDYAQSRDPGEPECIGGFIPLSTVYAFEPVPAALPAERQRHILGAQGNLWSEFFHTPRIVEYFAFPRAAALSEVVWSPAEGRNFADFERRLAVHHRRLEALDVNFRRDRPPSN